MKGRFSVKPVGKMGIHFRSSPASSRNRFRTRDQARITAFSERPNSSATFPAGTLLTPNRRNAFQVVDEKSRCTTARCFYPLQPVPVGGFRPGRLEPIQQAVRGRVHDEGHCRVLGSQCDRSSYPARQGNAALTQNRAEPTFQDCRTTRMFISIVGHPDAPATAVRKYRPLRAITSPSPGCPDGAESRRRGEVP